MECGYNGKTKIFLPHQFKTKISPMNGLPKIIISKRAYDKMWCLVDIADDEVGWFGTVVKNGLIYKINAVYLVDQIVDSTNTESLSIGLVKLAQRLQKKPNAKEILERIRFWGHSHVRMSVSPSGQDIEEMMTTAKDSKHDFFIRGILNKNGIMSFSIYDFRAGVVIDDVEWELENFIDSELYDKVKKQFASRVKKYQPQPCKARKDRRTRIPTLPAKKSRIPFFYEADAYKNTSQFRGVTESEYDDDNDNNNNEESGYENDFLENPEIFEEKFKRDKDDDDYEYRQGYDFKEDAEGFGTHEQEGEITTEMESDMQIEACLKRIQTSKEMQNIILPLGENSITVLEPDVESFEEILASGGDIKDA